MWTLAVGSDERRLMNPFRNCVWPISPCRSAHSSTKPMPYGVPWLVLAVRSRGFAAVSESCPESACALISCRYRLAGSALDSLSRVARWSICSACPHLIRSIVVVKSVGSRLDLNVAPFRLDPVDGRCVEVGSVSFGQVVPGGRPVARRRWG
jgi:hypothetical protein